MSRRSTGHVIERSGPRGKVFALRFHAYGERRYLTLGSPAEGWTRGRAREEMDNVLADVRRGTWVWRRRRARTGLDARRTTFGSFARRLVAERKGEVSDSQIVNQEWTLGHLLPYFADWSLGEIDVEAVDAYRHHKVREAEARRAAIKRHRPLRSESGRILRPLSAGSINKTIGTLQWVLSIALEYRLVTENAAVGKRRRLREPHRPVVHLDTAEQIEALIDAAEDLDRDPGFRLNERRAIVATLVFAGPRAVEIGHMLWRDVDLANRRLLIGRSKTQAGLREIRMLPILRDILAAHKASASPSGPDDLVFPTATGGRRDKDNLRSRVLGAVFDHADELLEEKGRVPLPRGLTPHKLRHTFASVLIACGEDPTLVTVQLGHTDPAFTLRTYSHLMSRAPGERERLKALVDGEGPTAAGALGGPPSALDCSAYEPSILRALARHGGQGSRREIRAAVADDLKGSFGDIDRERLPSGEPRWAARIDKAAANLRRAGRLRSGSSRGVWELAGRR
jgi:integrase